jgi:uncharacterized protein (DUF1015 family)
MAIIRPFEAYRPARGLEDRIAALPYDVYSRAEASAVVKERPLSFLRIDRAETQFSDDVGTYEDCVYEKARDMLQEEIACGHMVKDPSPSFYIYAQTMNGRTQTGLVACASIDDYQSGVIKRHENTRVDKEIDRIRHVDTCNAQTGPIFRCSRNQAVIDRIEAEKTRELPDCDFISDGNIRNRVWTISEPALTEEISRAFSEIGSIYIADGHHRCASAVKVGLKRREQNPGYTGEEEFNFFLSVLFPQDQLMIMDYNRVVRTLGGYTPETFLKACSKVAGIAPCGRERVHPASKSEIGMYLGGQWYRMIIRPQYRKKDPVEGLDVSILQDNILGPLLGITDPKADPRIEFVGGIRGLGELEERADRSGGAAFAMYPTSIQELFDVADAGRLMPPKSTWFEPKLLSGLFIHALD